MIKEIDYKDGIDKKERKREREKERERERKRKKDMYCRDI